MQNVLGGLSSPVGGVSSLFASGGGGDPSAAFEQLAAVAGSQEALAAACKALPPRALVDALKFTPENGKPLLLQAAAVNAVPTVQVLL